MVLRIPMRLAISDYPGDDTLDGLVYDGAHWSVRLATKLLRERAQAAASPWYPYLQAGTALLGYRVVFDCLINRSTVGHGMQDKTITSYFRG